MDGVGLLLIGASPYPKLFDLLWGLFFNQVTHLVVVAVNTQQRGGEEQELRTEQQHGVVNLSLGRKEEGGSPEKDCRAPG